MKPGKYEGGQLTGLDGQEIELAENERIIIVDNDELELIASGLQAAVVRETDAANGQGFVTFEDDEEGRLASRRHRKQSAKKATEFQALQSEFFDLRYNRKSS